MVPSIVRQINTFKHALLGRLVRERPLVTNLGRLVRECPLVDNSGRLAWECLLVAGLGRLAFELPWG